MVLGCADYHFLPRGRHRHKDKGYRLDQVRFGRSASSALPPALHKAFEEKFRISIVETMGITEAAAPVFSNPLILPCENMDPRARQLEMKQRS